MDTWYNDSLLPASAVINDGEDIEFALTPALKEDLRVKTTNFGTENGFEVWLDTKNPPLSSQATVTFNIFDDNSIIATKSFTIASNDAQALFRIPLVNSKDFFTFAKGSIIRVNMSVADAPVRITYEDSSNNGFLILHCNPISKITLAAHHSDGSLGEFYPNMPNEEQRFIQFRGTVSDAFGPYDVFNVTITLENVFPNTEAVYTFDDDDAIGQFTLDYNYPTGLASRDYEITATVTLNNDKGNSLTMATFGVYLECTEPNGEGFANEVVEFEIDVYNVGGQNDIMDLTATPDLPGWVASFQGGSKTTSIAPGEFDIKILEVTVASTAAKNEECIVSVTGRSSNPKAYTLDPPIRVVAIPKADFEFTSLNDLTKNIPSSGGTVEYDFKLRNIGQDKDIYTISADEPGSGSGWSAGLSTSHPDAVKKSDFEYELELSSYQEATFTFTVNSQQDPSNRKMELEVRATGTNVTETIRHRTTTTIEGVPGNVKLSANIVKKGANLGDTIDDNDTAEVQFSFSALNEDQIDEFSVSFSINNLPIGWSYSFSPATTDLKPEEQKSVSITVEFPQTTEANPDDGYKFTVKARYNSRESSLDLTVTIPEVFKVIIQTEQTEKDVVAGNEIQYEISVINKGNVYDVRVDISFTEIPGWSVSVDNPTVTLGEYNQAVKVIVTIAPSKSIAKDEKGYVDVKVRVSGETVSNVINLKTTVKKDPNEELTDFFTEYWYIPIFVLIIFLLTYLVWSRSKQT
jgi:uncharacterized membrane protein